jgi:hypothetical protein
MSFDWKLFTAALGLAFVLEGAVYFLAADKMPGVLKALSERSPSDLRKLGGTALILGLLILAFAKSFG